LLHTQEVAGSKPAAPTSSLQSLRIFVFTLLVAAGGCSGSFKPSDCVAAWNEDGPHAAIAAEGLAVAEITVGEDKAGQTGCGALFHSAPRQPWRFYGGVVEGGMVVRWDTQAGSSWTVDSPEGPIDATVRVRPDGGLSSN
jgi:hypothetical protein